MSEKHSLFGRYIATSQFTPPPFSLEAAEQNLLVTRMGGRDNLAQTFTLGENYVINSSTLNAVRFAYNNTDIHRTSTDFFSAPEVGINTYSYMPHYMLLNITGGFQLGGGTESQSTFNTPAWQISDDLTLVRGGHQFGFGGNVLELEITVAGQRALARSVHDGRYDHGSVGSPTSCSAGSARTASYRRHRTRSTWKASRWASTRRTRGALTPRVTFNYGLRWEPFFPQQLVNGAVYQFDQARFTAGTKSTRVPERSRRSVFPGRPWLPDAGGNADRLEQLRPARRSCVGSDWLGPHLAARRLRHARMSS